MCVGNNIWLLFSYNLQCRLALILVPVNTATDSTKLATVSHEIKKYVMLLTYYILTEKNIFGRVFNEIIWCIKLTSPYLCLLKELLNFSETCYAFFHVSEVVLTPTISNHRESWSCILFENSSFKVKQVFARKIVNHKLICVKKLRKKPQKHKYVRAKLSEPIMNFQILWTANIPT